MGRASILAKVLVLILALYIRSAVLAQVLVLIHIHTGTGAGTDTVLASELKAWGTVKIRILILASPRMQ